MEVKNYNRHADKKHLLFYKRIYHRSVNKNTVESQSLESSCFSAHLIAGHVPTVLTLQYLIHLLVKSPL